MKTAFERLIDHLNEGVVLPPIPTISSAADFGCEQCNKLPNKLDDLVIETNGTFLVDTDHDHYRLRFCSFCSQAYLEYFHEEWAMDGHDKMWQCWVPLSTVELAEINHAIPESTDDISAYGWLDNYKNRRPSVYTNLPDGSFIR